MHHPDGVRFRSVPAEVAELPQTLRGNTDASFGAKPECCAHATELSRARLQGGFDMAVELHARQHDTLEKIFSHSSSGNIEWRQVLSLLEAIGTTHHEHNGKLKVTVGPETEVFNPPRSKDIDEQMLVDLRRMLANAGFAPEG
jgi:hypothetical protein